MALVDDIADLLAIHNEVNTVCCQRQERVMDMVQLTKGNAILSNIYNFLNHAEIMTLLNTFFTTSLCYNYTAALH